MELREAAPGGLNLCTILSTTSMAKEQYKLTEPQIALTHEIVRGLRSYAEMLTRADLDDVFQHLLGSWSLFLCILAWEMVDSILLLTIAGNRRVAYALIRPLIEYYIRLRFYSLDVEKKAAPWYASGELGPAGVGITETEAFKDWDNASEKLLLTMKKSPFDFSMLDDNQRIELQGLIDKAKRYGIQRWKDMINSGAAGSDDARNLLDAEYGQSGAIIHGDQLAAYEITINAAENGGMPNFESLYSEHRVVATALRIAVQLMFAIGEATGREYGYRYFNQRLDDVF